MSVIIIFAEREQGQIEAESRNLFEDGRKLIRHLLSWSVLRHLSVREDVTLDTTSQHLGPDVVGFTIQFKKISFFSSEDAAIFLKMVSRIANLAELLQYYKITDAIDDLSPEEIAARGRILRFPAITHPAPQENEKELAGLNYQHKSIPDEFICPLSGTIMTTPMFAPSTPGTKFEESWIIYYLLFKEEFKNPLTRELLYPWELRIDLELESRIKRFIADVKAFDRQLLKQPYGPYAPFWGGYRFPPLADTESSGLKDQDSDTGIGKRLRNAGQQEP